MNHISQQGSGGQEDAIAIVGVACRLPGAVESPAEFWDLLSDGRSAVGTLPEGRWRWPDHIDPQSMPGLDRGAFLSDIARFDAGFFRISPREAKAMDPQQRLLLELGWQAVEHAGHRLSELRQAVTGVFMGVCHHDYRERTAAQTDAPAAYVGSGSAPAMLANRLSYHLDLDGPSVTMDTASSSALTAMHAAVVALHEGECAFALVGAANLMCAPTNSIAYHAAGMLSRRGACRPFDAEADGYVRGEGGVVLLLRPLADALRDGDTVCAVVRATAIGHGGRADSLTAPRPDAQARTIVRAMRSAGIDPGSVGYIEAHGSGTPLGDPVEIAGILDAYRTLCEEAADQAAVDWSARMRCTIGSVKGNIGHLEGAAGLAGLLKAVLAIHHRRIPQTVGFRRCSPTIDLGATPFRMADQAREWAPSSTDTPLRAGVSAYGFGGTTAHVVLEQAPVVAVSTPTPSSQDGMVFVLSARSETQLRLRAADLAAWSEGEGAEWRLEDIAGTLLWGREPLPERLVLLASDAQSLRAELRRFATTGGASACCLRAGDRVPEAIGKDPGARAAVLAWLAGDEEPLLARMPRPARRPPLPALRFEGEPHWVDAQAGSLPSQRMPSQRVAEGGAGAAHVGADVDLVAPAASAPAVVRLFAAERIERRLETAATLQWSQRWVLLVDGVCSGAESLSAWPSHLAPHQVRPAVTGADAARTALIDACSAARDLLRAAPRVSVLLQVVVEDGAPACAGLAGLLSGIRLEHPAFCGQVLRVPPGLDPSTLAAGLALAAADPGPVDMCWDGRRREALCWVPSVPAAEAAPDWRTDGVHVVVGDGRVDQLAAALRIALPGLRVETLGMRASDMRTDLEAGLARLRRTGPIRGVAYIAAMPPDTPVLHVDPDALRRRLEARLSSLEALEALTAEDRLDQFLVMTDVSGAVGMERQAEASGFEALAAARMARRRARGVEGRALCLAWPGAFAPSDTPAAALARLGERCGLRPAPVERIAEALRTAWAAPQTHLVALFADPSRAESAFAGAASRVLAGAEAAVRSVALEPMLRRTLKAMCAPLLELRVDQIDDRSSLREYGMESVAMGDFVIALNARFGLRLTPAVLFEHPNIGRLASHLAATEPDRIATALGVERSAGGAASPAASPVVSGAEIGADADADADARPGDEAGDVPDAIGDAVAIIGMSLRFPGAEGPDAFWRLLHGGESAIEEIPASRWDWRAIHGDPDAGGDTTLIKWGAFISGVEEFDPQFFGLSRQEARVMDPEHRLLLMHAWNAIEDAGYSADTLAGSDTAVYIGTGWSEYRDIVARSGLGVEAYTATGEVASVGPNRISYLLDLHGPSNPVETACSSSLVAIHRGMQAIQRGESALAIVGGVNTLLTPKLHVGFGKAGMLSPDGRCHTFSDRANGYVRGEGVCVLLLKSARRAIADGDPIHALLRASAENHGGRAASLTAPNPEAQANLILSAYRGAGVDPRAIGYIEAHGTGTPLGDPIEINGLKKAFATLAEERGIALAPGSCGVGSVKTNIGHLEVAAGIAGLVKVILQMRHRTLVASLNCERINPYIALEGSPFHVVRANRVWDAPQDAQGQLLPRRAGVSSFGFGGVNAHVLVEEYLPAPHPAAVRRDGPALMVLSARDPARLQERAAALRDALRDGALAGEDLHDIAYTLQVGRVQMRERLAFMAESVDQAVALLEAFVAGRPDDRLRRGSAGAGQSDALRAIVETEDMDRIVSAWLRDGRLDRLTTLWAGGVDLDWRALRGADACRRVRLPAYPFARERCWADPVPRAAQPAPAPVTAVDTDAVAEPATVRPAEDLAPARARSETAGVAVADPRHAITLDGEEFFLSGHVLGTHRVLPGVATLDRVCKALGAPLGHGAGLRIHDLVWLRPFVVAAEPRTLRVEFDDPAAGSGGFVLRAAASFSERDVDYVEGRVARIDAVDAAQLDLERLRARCIRGTLSAQRCYRGFDAVGFHYGEAFRTLVELRLGEGELLATLEIPPATRDTLAEHPLHPAIIDGAVQAAIVGFALEDVGGEAVLENRLAPAVPFELARAELLAPCTARMYASIRRVAAEAQDPAKRADDAGARVFDIDVCDEAGTCRVRLRGLAIRPFSPSALEVETFGPAPMSAPAGASLQQLGWRAVRMPADAPASGRVLLAGGGTVPGLVDALRACGLDVQRVAAAADAAGWRAALGASTAFDTVIWSPDPDAVGDGAGTDPVDAAVAPMCAGFALIRAMLDAGRDAQPLRWLVVTRGARAVHEGERPDPAQAGVHGLFATMAREYPDWDVRIVDLEAAPASDAAPALLEALAWPRAAGAARLRARRDGAWHEQFLSTPMARERVGGYRQNGVYVVIGGASGVGEAWSAQAAAEFGARTVWIGRRAPDAEVQARIDRIARIGPAPVYVRADASDAVALERARAQILETFGRIDGVVLSAMALQDQALAVMDERTFRLGLVPKVDVAVRAHRAFAADAPELMVFFSSVNAFAHTPGQCNYVAGCLFQDEFAHRLRDADGPRGCSVNWGYWGEIGAVSSDDYRSRMAAEGHAPLEPAPALAALAAQVRLGLPQALYVNLTRADDFDRPGASGVVEAAPDAPAQEDVWRVDSVVELPREDATRVLTARIREIVAATLGMPAAELGEDAAHFAAALLGQYGMDSLMATSFRGRLRRELEVDVPVHTIIGENVATIVDTVYGQLLMRRMARAAENEAGEDLETFVL